METYTNERGVEYVKVNDPKKPGDYLWIARTAFEPAVHQPWGGAEVPSAPPPAEPPPAEESKGKKKGKGNSLEGYDPPIQR